MNLLSYSGKEFVKRFRSNSSMPMLASACPGMDVVVVVVVVVGTLKPFGYYGTQVHYIAPWHTYMLLIF